MAAALLRERLLLKKVKVLNDYYIKAYVDVNGEKRQRTIQWNGLRSGFEDWLFGSKYNAEALYEIGTVSPTFASDQRSRSRNAGTAPDVVPSTAPALLTV